jgi:hypothetical protein
MKIFSRVAAILIGQMDLEQFADPGYPVLQRRNVDASGRPSPDLAREYEVLAALSSLLIHAKRSFLNWRHGISRRLLLSRNSKVSAMY